MCGKRMFESGVGIMDGDSGDDGKANVNLTVNVT